MKNNHLNKNTGLRLLINGVLLFVLVSFFSSCDEDEFLKEVPLDFYSPENSYVTYENFESALITEYVRVRDFYTNVNEDKLATLVWTATDIAYTHKDLGTRPNWESLLLPTNTRIVYDGAWFPAYVIIYDANVIIGRADAEESKLTEEEKAKVKAEAMFFRGYAYRILADLYGGVPLVLEETIEPKRDYVRAAREEIYTQCVSDFKFAAENLPDITEVDDSRVSNMAAYHFLAEAYISLGKWQEAIDAASEVIDHPATALMTERFGTRANEEPNPLVPWSTGGDVYWDLFRQGNQNRSAGNTEAIWVIQYEFNVTGGGNGGPLLERLLVPRLWQAKITNANGSSATIVPNPNTYYFGRGSGFVRPSHYFYETVWQKSGEQDIRNSEYNIVRDFRVYNPSSDYNGKWIFKDNLPISLSSSTDTMRNYYPVVAKASTPGKHPVELYLPDQTIPGSLTSDARYTYRDQYAIRLAETYLLRAEAYLGNNNTIKAVEDINIIRRRAHAPEIEAFMVDIDYILDERMRELYFEEFRLLTLTRLGKLVERTKELNPWVGETYASHNDLWPIPYDDIEKNTEAVLEQNPGY